MSRWLCGEGLEAEDFPRRPAVRLWHRLLASLIQRHGDPIPWDLLLADLWMDAQQSQPPAVESDVIQVT